MSFKVSAENFKGYESSVEIAGAHGKDENKGLMMISSPFAATRFDVWDFKNKKVLEFNSFEKAIEAFNNI